MNKYELVSKIEQMAPIETQEDWDMSGWLVCRDKTDIDKVLLALTVTDDIYEQAKAQCCDMIISHHPLFFVPLKYSDIDIYCAHTNMDKAKGGTTDTLIKALGLQPSEISSEFVRIVRLNEPMKFSELEKRLRNISPNLRYTNNKCVKEVSSIGFCAGSGSEFINETDADVFVTGDLKFHTALDSKIPVFDIGHFESEIHILKVIREILPVTTIIADEKSPFIYAPD